LDPQTAVVIDDLIQKLTRELNMTTIIITHDMNSVMGIGEQVFFIHQGLLHWKGSNQQILTEKNKILNDFIYASPFLKQIKDKMIK